MGGKFHKDKYGKAKKFKDFSLKTFEGVPNNILN